MADLAYLNSFFDDLRQKHKQQKKPQAENEIADLILFEMAEQENISGYELTIEQKKQRTGAYRYSDGKHFIYDKDIRAEIKDIPNHKHIFFTIGKDGFMFEKSQFSSLFDTNILYSRLRDLISDHKEKQTKINAEDTEILVRKWQSVADLRNTLINT